jgi:hypothetical protein
MRDVTSKLWLSYYKSVDGPRIMIFGPLNADFTALAHLFRALPKMPNGICDLHSQPFLNPVHGIEIVMSCIEPGLVRVPPLLRQIGPYPPARFRWRRPNRFWINVSHAVHRLAKVSSPSHQYLSSYPPEPAIIVASKGEYGDEVIDAMDGVEASV